MPALLQTRWKERAVFYPSPKSARLRFVRTRPVEIPNGFLGRAISVGTARQIAASIGEVE